MACNQRLFLFTICSLQLVSFILNLKNISLRHLVEFVARSFVDTPQLMSTTFFFEFICSLVRKKIEEKENKTETPQSVKENDSSLKTRGAKP